jgi:hypothetical protein
MTTHIQRLYAKIQANRLNDKAFRERVKNDMKYVWAAIGMLAVTMLIIAVKL